MIEVQKGIYVDEEIMNKIVKEGISLEKAIEPSKERLKEVMNGFIETEQRLEEYFK